MGEVSVVKVGGSGWGYAVLGLTIVGVGALIYFKLKRLQPGEKIREVKETIVREVKEVVEKVKEEVTEAYDTSKLEDYVRKAEETGKEQAEEYDLIGYHDNIPMAWLGRATWGEAWVETHKDVDEAIFDELGTAYSDLIDLQIEESLKDEEVKQYVEACEKYGACM